ncbi:MAG TPA: PAS domain S-box protein [Terriglobia bacterium]|nr:PAS domain S-box protein [Terriglobia bacterium]
MKHLAAKILQHPVGRYAFGLTLVAVAFGVRWLLIPLTGIGAPYVLIFAAVLITSLFAGAGPGLAAVLVGTPLGAYLFVVGGGYTVSQAASQGLLFTIDGVVVVYLTALVRRTRHHLEEANRLVRSAEEQFRLTLDEAPIGIALVSPDGHFLRVNHALCEILGYGESELVNRDFHFIAHPQDQQADFALQSQLARGDIPRYQLEKNYVRKDGSFVPVIMSVSVLRDKAGALVHYIVQVQDITERKQAEEALRRSSERLAASERRKNELAQAALRESEEKLKAAFANSAIGFAITDTAGHYIDANAAYCRITGYDVAELRAIRFSEIIHSEDRETNMLLIHSMIAGEIPGFQVENRYVRKNGEPIWVRKSISVVRAESGEPRWIIALIEDITGRRQAEMTLRENRELLRAVVEGTSDAVTVTDDMGRFVLFNQAAARFVGKRPEDVLGHDATFVFPNDEAKLLMEQNRAVAAYGETVTRENVITTADGERRTFSVTLGPLRDATGGVSGVFSISRDMTDHRRMEEASRARAAAEEANRQKDQFLAMLGHELRNPLAAIQMAVALFRRKHGADFTLQKAIDMVQRQTEQAIRIVDDLLEVSRAAIGKLTLKKQQVDVMTVVRNAVETSRPLIDSKRLDLAVAPLPGDITLEADPARLAQALVNLLTNAARYTPAGGRIALSVDADDQQVVFRVRDTGAGIPPAMLETIFEPFVQANRSIERSHGGLGLGLSLVRKIVELHGGMVCALSEGQGKGSEFAIRIPIGDGAGEHEGRSGTAKSSTAKGRVLVVDDNQDLAEGLAVALSAAGYDVRRAFDGPSAIEVAGTFRPDVVLLDIGLPVLDGYEVARRLRGMKELEGITLVALSGYGEDEDRQQAKEAGFDAHLVKPADLAQIEEILASRRGQDVR